MGFVLLDLWFYMYVLEIVVCPFVLFPLAIVLSVLLRYADFDSPFGIFKFLLRYPLLYGGLRDVRLRVKIQMMKISKYLLFQKKYTIGKFPFRNALLKTNIYLFLIRP